jgi:uncharacterized membrane protein YbhN (UPF0104 family)
VQRTAANPGNPHWSPTWRTDPVLAGGGILFDHGAHIFYQLRSLLGDPAAVQATLRTLGHSTYGVEDSAIVILDYGDRLAEVRLTWAARRRAIRFHFVGADGELVGDDEHVVVRAASSEELSFGGGMSQGSSHSGWYAPLLHDFVRRVRDGDRSTEPLDEALYVARLIARAYESSASGRALPLQGPARPAATGRALSAVAAAVSQVVEAPPPDAGPPPPVKTARRTPWVFRLAGVGVLAVAAGWVARGVAWRDLVQLMGHAHAGWITLACAVYLGAVFAMAGRWRALLRPLAPFVTHADALKAMVVGSAASMVVPGRAGELARARWMSQRTGLPPATLLGSIFLDLLVNATGLFVAVAVLPSLLDLPPWAQSGINLAIAVFGVALALLFVLRPRPGMPALGASAVPEGRIATAVAGFVARVRLGLAAVREPRALAYSLGASLVAWALEVEVVLCTLHAFDIHVRPGVALLVLVAVNLAMVVPFAPPANLGTVEVGAILALMEYGVPKEHALAFALVYHGLQVIPIGLGGLALASRSLLGTPAIGLEPRPAAASGAPR